MLVYQRHNPLMTLLPSSRPARPETMSLADKRSNFGFCPPEPKRQNAGHCHGLKGHLNNMYPPVNIQTTMEHHHFYWENSILLDYFYGHFQ